MFFLLTTRKRAPCLLSSLLDSFAENNFRKLPVSPCFCQQNESRGFGTERPNSGRKYKARKVPARAITPQM